MKGAPDPQRRLAAGGRPEAIWRPSTCQWLEGDGPFTDADKCGRPVWTNGAAYCERHAKRAQHRSGGGQADGS